MHACRSTLEDPTHDAIARPRWVNAVVGWSCAAVLAAPFSAFRFVHLEHHRHTNDEKLDPDTWSARGSTFTRALRWATQDLSYYVWYAQRARSRPLREVLQVVVGSMLIVVAASVVSLTGHARDVVLLWLVPGRVAVLLLALLFDWLPHRPHEVLGREDPLRATSVIEHRFLTPILLGQNYHLVHHLYPGAPFYRYAAIWWTLRARLIAEGAIVHRIGAPKRRVTRAGVIHPLLRVVEVVEEAPGVRTFVLEVPVTLRPAYAFRAGQFVAIGLPSLPGAKRCYSLSRAPREHGRLSITVKRVSGGRVSPALHAGVAVGSFLAVAPPRGRFVLLAGESVRPLLLFAGGAGVTPCFAIIEEALAVTSRPIKLVYAMATSSAAIFVRDLAALVERYAGRLEVEHRVDDVHGRLCKGDVARELRARPESDVYVCGPPGMMDVVIEGLDAEGVPSERRFVERFGPAAHKARGDLDARAAGEVDIVSATEHRHLTVHAGETILEGCQRARIAVPSSCEAGYCGTCVARLASGQVEDGEGDALDAHQRAGGLILLCRARPRGNETVVVHVDA